MKLYTRVFDSCLTHILCSNFYLFPSQIHRRHLQIANGGTWQLTATHNDIVDRDEHELHRVANEAFVFPKLEDFHQKKQYNRENTPRPNKVIFVYTVKQYLYWLLICD